MVEIELTTLQALTISGLVAKRPSGCEGVKLTMLTDPCEAVPHGDVRVTTFDGHRGEEVNLGIVTEGGTVERG